MSVTRLGYGRTVFSKARLTNWTQMAVFAKNGSRCDTLDVSRSRGTNRLRLIGMIVSLLAHDYMPSAFVSAIRKCNRLNSRKFSISQSWLRIIRGTTNCRSKCVCMHSACSLTASNTLTIPRPPATTRTGHFNSRKRWARCAGAACSPVEVAAPVIQPTDAKFRDRC